MKNVLIVAPHPDDETLGCGGTILKYVSKNIKFHWLIITKMTKEAGYSSKQIISRTNEIKIIKKKYNFSTVFEMNFLTARLDTYPLSLIIKEMSKVIKDIKPDTIFFPNRNDIHTDHRITFDAVIASTKSFNFDFVKNLLVYETLSETHISMMSDKNDFIPNLWIDINKQINKKIDIMKIYKSEFKKFPHPRSIDCIKSLAKLRGSEVNLLAAEAFKVLRKVYK